MRNNKDDFIKLRAKMYKILKNECDVNENYLESLTKLLADHIGDELGYRLLRLIEIEEE